MRSLGLEIPEHPPLSMALERAQLRLNIAPHVALERLVPIRDIAFIGTAPYERGAGVRAIVAGPDGVSVE